ncbi:MAG: transcriptional regulator [Anaerolineales bacterium]
MTDKEAIFAPLLAVGDFDKTVHEPARLMLLSILSVLDQADFVFLHHLTGLTRGNLSTHMRRLEEDGYVRVEKEFVDRRPVTGLSITPKGRNALKDYRDKMRQFLDELE